jgi:uncharacterized protein (DUF934 family)
MALIKDGKLVEDPWFALDDEAPIPQDRDVIVGLERWRRDRAALMQRPARLGVRLTSDQLAGEIARDLADFDLVALEFPKFADGRAYSTARLLRERHGFTGELRAAGNVLRDQFVFLHRCGFDAYQVADARAAESWLEALGEIQIWYQPTADGRTPVSHRRQTNGKTRSNGTAEAPRKTAQSQLEPSWTTAAVVGAASFAPAPGCAAKSA